MRKIHVRRDGYVNAWTDAAKKGEYDGEKNSAEGCWFAPGHIGNMAYVLDLPVKSNYVETLTIILATL